MWRMLKWYHHITAIATLPAQAILKWQFFYESKAFLFYCADHHKSNSIFNLTLPILRSFALFISVYFEFYCCTRPQRHSVIFRIIWLLLLFVQSLHFNVDALRVGGNLSWNGIEVAWTSRHLFDHVSLHFSPLNVVIRSSGTLTAQLFRSYPVLESSLICEVNWHVFIWHHVIKSNLRHPHVSALNNTHKKPSWVKCFIKMLNFI